MPAHAMNCGPKPSRYDKRLQKSGMTGSRRATLHFSGRLDAAGLTRHDGGPAMKLDLMAFSSVATPAELRVSVVEDDEAYARWGHVMYAAMGLDAGTQEAINKMLPLLGYRAPQRHDLGVVDSEPVAQPRFLSLGRLRSCSTSARWRTCVDAGS